MNQEIRDKLIAKAICELLPTIEGRAKMSKLFQYYNDRDKYYEELMKITNVDKEI